MESIYIKGNMVAMDGEFLNHDELIGILEHAADTVRLDRDRRILTPGVAEDSIIVAGSYVLVIAEDFIHVMEDVADFIPSNMGNGEVAIIFADMPDDARLVAIGESSMGWAAKLWPDAWFGVPTDGVTPLHWYGLPTPEDRIGDGEYTIHLRQDDTGMWRPSLVSGPFSFKVKGPILDAKFHSYGELHSHIMPNLTGI